MSDRPATTWMEQFVLRGRGAAEVLSPFGQALAAGQTLSRVAEERTGLTIREYDAVESARLQALVLTELVQQLDDQVTELSHEADRSTAADPGRAGIRTASLTGVVRATATLVEACHALLRVGESLLVVRGPKARIELAAAVETLRAAVGTSQITVQANLARVTDARTYDQLAEGLPSFDLIRAHADRVSRELRDRTAPVESRVRTDTPRRLVP